MWQVNFGANRTLKDFKIDSTAQANILPFYEYNRLLNRPKLHSSKVRLSSYNGAHISLKRSCILQVKHRTSTILVFF